MGCRGVADGVYPLATSTGNVVAITGAPGCGKTSLLDMIAAGKEIVAPYGTAPAPSDVLRPGLDACKIVIEWGLNDDELAYAGLEGPSKTEAIVRRSGLPDADGDPGLVAVLERYSHYAGYGKIDYFPDDRAISQHAVLVSDLVVDQQLHRLTRGAAKYAALSRFTRQALTGQDEGRLGETLKELFHRLCPRKKLVGVGGLGTPVFHTESGGEMPVDKLAASEKMAFLFAATFVMVGLHESVVLIDTPELRLGPGEAARYVRELAAFAPTSQLVVATMDPAVLELAGSHTVRLEAA
jgi:energy-coupling factor transporter ATP-binding protein EcfA2